MWARVLAAEQRFQLPLHLVRASVLVRSIECVHRQTVVLPEAGDELRRRATEVEGKRVFATSNGLSANIAPKTLTTRSNIWLFSSCRLDASPC